MGYSFDGVRLGAGTPMFQRVNQTLKLQRIQQLAFANGVVFVRYRMRN
jgi:hypothetical protein